MNQFSTIPIFIEVVDSGSFSTAARKLNISKAAVSKRISTLESHLGVRLLRRTTRQLYLTEAGERYYQHASKALLAATDAENSVTQLQSKPEGKLRIHTLMTFGQRHLAPLISTFMKQYPGIEIDMVLDDNLIDLMDGHYDIVIRAGHLPDSNLIARKLAPLRSVVCASPKYLAQHGSPDSPADLQQHNCLSYTYSPNAKDWTFISKQGSLTLTVNGNLQVNNSEALRQIIVDGAGIGRLPTFIVGKDLQAGKLVPLFSQYQMPTLDLFAIYTERQFLPARIKVFLDFITARFQTDMPYWDR